MSSDKDQIHFISELEYAAPADATEADASDDDKPSTDDTSDPAGAFNAETGEINWDCPCLGGMAQGPCGEEFKSAFTCFVFSQSDTKGADCLDAFQGMQSCFQQFPEYYSDQLSDAERQKMDDKAASASAESDNVLDVAL